VSPRANKSAGTPLAGQRIPAREAPGQTYGERQQQQQDQRTIPMATPPNAAPTPAPGAALSAPAPAPRPPTPGPGELPWTDAPTNRPDEPVTQGLPFGPGAGPEVMKGPTAAPLISDQLAAMAADPNANSAVTELANVARALGI
jgi:hypothetical protein